MDVDRFNRAFTEALDAAFATYGGWKCISDKRQAFTYSDVDSLSRQVANRLIEGGFPKGGHGAVYGRNSAMALILALGVIRAGGVWIPVNDRNPVKANVAILKNLGCDVLFHELEFEDAAPALCEVGQCRLGSVCFGEDESGRDDGLERWVAGASMQRPNVQIAGEDPLCLPQTGGTTGAAKGVILSHRNFCSIAHVAASDSYEPGGTMLCAAPMTHVGGRMVLATLPLGYRYVVLEKIETRAILQAIEAHRITHVFLPPAAIYGLLDAPDLDAFDLSSLRRVHYTSSPMSPDRLEEAIGRFGPILQGGYSQTECPMSISFLRPEDHFVDGRLSRDRLKSVGRANTGTQIAILGDDGRALEPGGIGEIAVKSSSVCEGYYGDPVETQKIRHDGWHLTGDIGYLDADGFLFIVDRKKDMIITGGFNVYSAEVEHVIMQTPGVAHAAVVGLPHEKWGEEVTAFVELKPGAPTSAADIIDRCKSAIGSVKAPKQVVFVEALPRTAVGKIDKKALRAANGRS